jgi:hypothetical protein
MNSPGLDGLSALTARRELCAKLQADAIGGPAVCSPLSSLFLDP